MSRQFAVIGLGRLGTSLAETLDSLGHDVLGIDIDKDLVQDLADDLPNVHLVAADVTEASVLRDLGLEDFDGVAVVTGNMQAGILVTLMLKEMGVPLVIARAVTEHHARVLDKVGADRVVQPEREMGAQLARTMASPTVVDYVDLGGDEALIEVEVPKKWIGKTLSDLHLYRKSGVTVIALHSKTHGGTIPRGDTELKEGDVLVIGGPKKRLDELDVS
jgi:trk system potassium uptake protein TrkA